MNITDSVRNYLTEYTGPFLPKEIGKDLDLESKQVSSALSRMLKKGEVTKDEAGAYALVRTEDETPAEEPVEAPEEADEDLIGDTPAEPTPAPEKAEEEVLYYETLEFPGNYSIVTAPGALEIAEAAGVPAKSENIKGSLTRKVFLGGDDMDKAAAVAAYIPKAVAEALADLKEWQKKHIERRRGLTDMQRYVEHREFIAKQMHKSALAVKKNGIPA